MKTAPSSSATWSRRRLLKTVFCSSAALGLNLRPDGVSAAETAADDQHWFALGDFGSMQPAQSAVADGLKAYVARVGAKPQGLLLLGDNFYSKMTGGLKSERWKTGFDDMYPKSVFDCPCPAVLGNHDYHDNAGGELVQVEYSKQPGTRWTMPDKWYRIDMGGVPGKPLITFLCLDTNFRAVSGGTNKKDGKVKNSLIESEENEQLFWFKEELKKPRASWTIVMGHHPLYSNGVHGDSKPLQAAFDSLLQESGVHLYMCGHDHDLQHLEFAGKKTSHILSGGGGARVREQKVENRGPYSKAIYGFSHLQVNEKRMVFRHIDANGKLLHEFEKRPDFSFSVTKVS
jgi:tartrate-resistant acid phosphatase type 5